MTYFYGYNNLLFCFCLTFASFNADAKKNCSNKSQILHYWIIKCVFCIKCIHLNFHQRSQVSLKLRFLSLKHQYFNFLMLYPRNCFTQYHRARKTMYGLNFCLRIQGKYKHISHVYFLFGLFLWASIWDTLFKTKRLFRHFPCIPQRTVSYTFCNELCPIYSATNCVLCILQQTVS